MRISVCFLDKKENSQQIEQKLNKEKINIALRKLFEVTDKYDIMALNSFFTNEILALVQQFDIADLIAIGDQYTNIAILDAGFGKLDRNSAHKMVFEEQNVWMKNSTETKERFILGIGKLLFTNH